MLTGHEHVHDRSITVRPEVEKSTYYVEGSPLQETQEPNTSAFNVTLIDIETAQQQFHHFVWDGTYYKPTSEEDLWEPLPLEAYKTADVFEVDPNFRAWLIDPGIPNLDRAGKNRTLLSIFVYPELIELFRDPSLNQKRRIVQSDDVSRELLKYQQVFISAPPKAGRTALARRLYLDYLNDGFVPVYLDAATDSMRPADGFPKAVLRRAEAQYGSKLLEPYRQLGTSRRVLIIDNIEKSRLRLDSLVLLIEQLASIASNVIVIGDDTAGSVSELAPIVEGDNVRRAFEIRPLNRGLRERFAQQWFDRNDEPQLDDAARSQRLHDAARTLDTVIGRNYVPAFPIFVIAVLQAIEDNANIDVRASTHGYFYEVLIRLALVGGSASDFNVRSAFLTHVAFEMFTEGREEWLLSELESSFGRYQQIYGVGGLEYRNLIDSLVSRGMLVIEADRVRFRYAYLYYYFVANHLRNNINKNSIRKHVTQLTRNLDDDKSSDILMFLAHLTSDEFVVEQLLEAASHLYANKSEATLETVPGKQTASDLPMVYTERPIEEARLERAKRSDEFEKAGNGSSDRERGRPSDSEEMRTFASAISDSSHYRASLAKFSRDA